MTEEAKLRRRGRIAWAVGSLLVAAAIAASFLLWWRLETASPMGAIDPDDSSQAALGLAVYAAECASCHGDKLQGQPEWRSRRADGRLPAPPHDETGHTWHHPDAVLFGITKFGLGPYAPQGYESDMPVFEAKLTDEKIRAVLAYIKSTWPERIRKLQERANVGAQQ